jgi:hypothetical protein
VVRVNVANKQVPIIGGGPALGGSVPFVSCMAYLP